MSQLEKVLENATNEFRKKVANGVFDPSITKTCHGKEKTIPISSKALKQHCGSLVPTKINAGQFIEHYETLERYMPFCSPRESFAKLLRMNSNKDGALDKLSVEDLKKSGAHFHTLRMKNDMVFDTSAYQSGVRYGQEDSTRGLISTIGSKENQYEDVITPDGFVKYEPPCNQAGFLRYRWVQFLKQKYKIPMFFLLVKWFALEDPIPDVVKQKKFEAQKGKFVFMITPVTVVSSDVQNDHKEFFSNVADLNNLGKLFDSPLPLQIIEPDECFQIIRNLDMMNSSKSIFQDRQQLPLDLEMRYRYDSLKGKHLGKQLQKWAKKTGKKCPDGTKCKNQEFSKIPKLHLGHIISRDWCKAFKFQKEFMDHPYNLYLTCSACNGSLNKRFPYSDLQDRLDEDKATIGDWAIQFDSAIRNTQI